MLDSRTVRAADGLEHDLLEAIEALHWVDQLCPLMPHQYAALRKSPDWAWFALDAMIRWSPDSFLAYFRGYRRPNRYWEAPDGLRYWRTRFELNRCTLDSVEPPRRVDEGARPIPDWVGPPHAPNGAGLYVEESGGRWWPRFDGTNMQPCRACRR
jgi:hypothetical protein